MFWGLYWGTLILGNYQVLEEHIVRAIAANYDAEHIALLKVNGALPYCLQD